MQASPTDPVERTVALEMYLPSGPWVPFGVLGGRLVGAADHERVVSVGVTDGPGQPVDWRTVLADRTWIGMPDEYAGSVLAGALSAPQIDQLGASFLRFDFAVHGDISSSEAMFNWLARNIVWLLATEPNEIHERMLRQILAQRVPWRRNPAGGADVG